MSINILNRVLTDNKVWWFFSTFAMLWYLSPLIFTGGAFYVPTFDNLDSTVVWYKILAKSGMIFAANDAIIPNMMNGLPRSSYGSEFDFILWLYYFFEAKTAFIINEILIHLVAFISMFIFLKRYIVKRNAYYQDVPIFVGALYFALIPYWSGAGISIASLPIVTYALLNIKNNNSTKWDWILLVFLPLYSSFIFLYMFYIIMAGLYLIWDTVQNRQLNKQFFLALCLMGILFLVKEYRLVQIMFFDHTFISHRVEFDLFFKENLWESYRLSLVNLLLGHKPHAQALQNIYLLPIVLIAMAISLFRRRLNVKESVVVWLMVIISFSIDLWSIVLVHRFTIPGIIIFSLVVLYLRPRYRLVPLLLLLVIILSISAAAFEYNGLKWITELFPIFNAFNMIRLLFVEPFILVVLLTASLIIIYRNVKFSIIIIIIFILFQLHYSKKVSYYQVDPLKEYASFDDYYVPDTFEKIKKSITEDIETVKVVGYGIEPAVMLYNGLHTVDGYSPNYPLDYKYKFKQVFAQYTSQEDNTMYDLWGSKVYIISVSSQKADYIKGLDLEVLRFNPRALCELNTTYVISPYNFLSPKADHLRLTDMVKGEGQSWNIYLYKLDCTF